MRELLLLASDLLALAIDSEKWMKGIVLSDLPSKPGGNCWIRRGDWMA